MIFLNPRFRSRDPRRSLLSNLVSAPVSTYGRWSPESVNPRLWLDASDPDTITSSGGAVSEWRDKSASKFTFTQATSASRPTTGSVTQNGLNVISFDGVTDFLNSPQSTANWAFLNDPSLSNISYTIGMVFKRNTINSTQTLLSTQEDFTRNGIAVYVSSNLLFVQINWASTAALISTFPSLGTSTATRMFTFRCNAVSPDINNRSFINVDGQATLNTVNVDASTSYTATHMPLRLGQYSSSANRLNGFIAEVVVVTGTASTELNRNLLHDYLNRKWAVY